MDIAKFKKLPVIGILRGISLDLIEPLVETAYEAGLETLEITLNTENALELIARAKKIAGSRMSIGAGTVMDIDAMQTAQAAGASFAVLPTLVPEVVKYCLQNKIPVFPGALTPQEIYNAWRAGATMVKVFPARTVGPEYFREIKGPFQDIQLLACGGVTPENMPAYFYHGANAITFGASVFKQEWLQTRDFDSIGKLIRKYIKQIPLE
jgi:2-dehydro-3-deoxyphosphogluconate aldolase/(4S)-4-hydroxy-2-oxoglutarate aldolase